MTGMAPYACNRARALLSQRLDAPLSAVEEREIARHTARCAGCRAFDEQSRWLTKELRAAVLEPLPRPVTVTPIRVRRVTSRVLGSVASAAALVVVAVGAGVVGLGAGDSSNDLRAPAEATSEAVSGDALKALHADALRAGELPILPESAPPPSVKPARPATDA